MHDLSRSNLLVLVERTRRLTVRTCLRWARSRLMLHQWWWRTNGSLVSEYRGSLSRWGTNTSLLCKVWMRGGRPQTRLVVLSWMLLLLLKMWRQWSVALSLLSLLQGPDLGGASYSKTGRRRSHAVSRWHSRSIQVWMRARWSDIYSIDMRLLLALLHMRWTHSQRGLRLRRVLATP